MSNRFVDRNTTNHQSTTTNIFTMPQSVVASTLVFANGRRLKIIITNSSSANLFILLSQSGASATVFTVKMATNTFYEVPVEYAGAISGLWDGAGAGTAVMTEIIRDIGPVAG